MRTVGVDLAAEAKKTAVAVVSWRPGHAEVTRLEVGQTDDDIVRAADDVAKVGIDCPFGWPEPFIDFITAHRDGRALEAHDLPGRRVLAYRETDRAVVAAGGPRPLSVAADLIAHPAMRAAGILAALAKAGYDVDRAGTGLVVESYPAAALKRWSLPHTRYKGAEGHLSRAALVDELVGRCPALALGRFSATVRDSDDALDAVICALIARAAATGRVVPPTDEQAARAATEGWIGVPTCDLSDLVHPT